MPSPKPGKGIPAEWQRQLAALSAFSRPLKPLQRSRLCSGCWRLTAANEAKDSNGRFCRTCSEQSLVLKSLRRCGGCDKIYPADAGSTDGPTWRCQGCSTSSAPAPGGYPQLAHAQLRSLSAAGIDIEVPGAGAKAHRLPWSLLQPVPKPSIEPGAARAKWRFHCIDLGDQPSDFCNGPENCWEVEWSFSEASSSSSKSNSWRTGHLDVRVFLHDQGTCQVQQMPGAQSCSCPQLLCLGPRVHLCLEHREQPLKAFRRRREGESEHVSWPAETKKWSSCASYAAAWRQLNFMEAASTAVAESDGRLLDGVAVRFFEGSTLSGAFDVPVDLIEAHQLRLRPDDLLCLRWPRPAGPRQRPVLIKEAFRALTSLSERLKQKELRKLATFTGFDGTDEDWSKEYASLCAEFGVTEEEGLGLAEFSKLVDDESEKGCICSDDELRELKQLYGDSDSEGPSEVWVGHAIVESADKFGDSLQVRFYLCEVSNTLGLPQELRSKEPTPGFAVELLWLPETYHYQGTALAELPQSAPLIQNLILYGGVERPVSDPMRDSNSFLRDLSHYQLNDSQLEAVRSALSSPVTLVHGPPGTGKTRTAAVVALTFASHNAQSSAKACILYAANSNRAVDVAAEAITELSTERLEDLFETQAQDEKCAICWGEGCNAITFCGHVFHRHCLMQALKASVGGRRNCPMCRAALKSIDGIRLLRVYSSDTENLEFPIPKAFRYDGVRERRRFAVPEEMRRFALHWRIHNKVASHFNPRAAACEAAYEKLMLCSPQSSEFEAVRTSYLEARQEARAFEFQSCNILLATNCSCRRGWIPQLLQKENIELRQVVVDECGTSPEPETLCPLTLSKAVQRVVLVVDYRQLRPVVKNRDAGSLGLACSLFERLSTGAGDLEDRDAASKHLPDVSDLQDLPPDRAQLVFQAFCALRGSSSCSLQAEDMQVFAERTGWEGTDSEWREEFKVLCSELGVESVDLKSFARLVEDRSEKGCFCSNEELEKLGGLATPSLGEQAVPPSQPTPSLQAPPSVLLRQQYRMHPSMNSFPSKQFYGGKVFSDKSTQDRPAGMLAHGYTGSPSPVLFWTSPPTFQEEVHEVATKDSSTRSKANVREAERCARLAAEIAARAGSKSVAVLSWYNAQVVELKSELRRLGAKGVHVGSVVTAQGSEWDYVLLSTVLSNGSGLTEAGQRLGCLADKHLLNVAVSRGRVGLVVLGSPEVLRLDRHWAAFLEHCKGLGGILQDGDSPGFSGRSPGPGVPAVLQQTSSQDPFRKVLEQYRQQKVQAAGSQQFYKQLAREPSQATSAASPCPYPAAEARELCIKLLPDGKGSTSDDRPPNKCFRFQ